LCDAILNIGDDQDQVAGLGIEPASPAGLDACWDKLLDGPGKLVRLHLDPGQALGTGALGQLLQLFDPFSREPRRAALGIERTHLASGGERLAKDLELT